MGRARGTYTVHTNWVDDLAPTLPGAAGWVLQRLDAQSNYKRQEMTLGQLIDCLPYKERTVQVALAHLRQEGYIVALDGAQVLRGACAELAQDLRKDMHPQWDVKTVQDGETARVYFSISLHNQKEEKEENKRDTDNTRAQNSTAPVEALPSQESLPEINTPAVASQTNAPSLETVPRRPAAEMPELPDDLAALPGLIEAWSDWLQYRKERRFKTVPSTAKGMFVNLRKFAEEGLDPVEVIRNSIAQSYQGLFPAKGHIVKFQPAPAAQVRDDGEIDMDALIRNAPLNGTRR